MLPDLEQNIGASPQTDHHPETVLRFNDFELITGQSNPQLAREVGKLLEHVPDEPIILFTDGEVKAKISHNLRRRHAVVIQSTSPPHVNDYIMETLIMIDAARRASADEITVVLPYFGYARQDKKDQPRVPISASLVANLLTMTGANRIVTIDIHAEQAQGYVLDPWDNIYASHAVVPVIKNDIDTSNLVVVSPDVGATKRTAKYAEALGVTNLAVVYKEREITPNSKSKALFLIGDVEGKDALITDDLLKTGGTLVDAAEMLVSKGAKRIYAAVTHGLFLEDALTDIEKSSIEKVYVTDTIAHRHEVKNNPKIQIISIAPMLAEAIQRIHTGEGLTDLFT